MSATRLPRDGDHEMFDELAVGWALHALEPEDEALFARHLPDCARCARTVAETGEVMAALAADLPPAEPSEDLRSRLRAAIEETEQIRRPPRPQQPQPPAERPRATGAHAAPASSAGSPPVPRITSTAAWPPPGMVRPLWRRRLPQALVAAAVAAILGLGAWTAVLGAQREQAQATAAAQAQVIHATLGTPGQATIDPVSDREGHTVATVVARQGQAQIVTWGLATNNPRATTYVLWGMREGSPVPLGTFDVMQPGLDLRTVGSDKTGLDDFSAYAISLESGRTAPQTPTDIVANGQVSS